jgi:homoserine kinase
MSEPTGRGVALTQERGTGDEGRRRLKAPGRRAGNTAWLDHPVTVRVPATSANLGPGFDALGLALGLHDEVLAWVTGGGLEIEVTGVGERTARNGEQHLVVRAMRAAFDVLGGQPPGIRLRCVNAIPHGFGLGSSAAAIVAGILAARGLCADGERELPGEAVLRLAADLEGHADNVAACLAGGLTIAWRGGGERGGADRAGERAGRSAGGLARCVRLDPLAGLAPVLCIPAVPLATEAARRVLPAAIPHADAVKNAARAALLVAALTQGSPLTEPGILLDATEDFLHQPYRADSMPHTAELVRDLRGTGIPAVVSGAGPAVLALIVPDATAGPDVVRAVADRSGHGWAVRVVAVDRDGATVRC